MMATTQEITGILDRLISAYPTSKIDNQEETILVYADSLEDIPGYLLEEAVDECIKTMKWFPSVSEVRKEASKLAHSWDELKGKHIGSPFSHLPEEREDPEDYRIAEDNLYHELVQSFCSTPRQFDEETWLRLIKQLKMRKREAQAHSVVQRYEAFKWTVENEHTTMYAEDCAAYAITDEQREEYA